MPAFSLHQSMSNYSGNPLLGVRVSQALWNQVWSEIGQERLGLPPFRIGFSPTEDNPITQAIRNDNGFKE